MANTLTAGVAVNILAVRYPRLLLDGQAARLADEVQSYIWHRYPWRPSIVELPPFNLMLEEPDYGPPVYAVPGDFYGLHKIWLRSIYTRSEPLTVRRDLEISQNTGIPNCIAYQPEVSSFRLHPRPSLSAPDWWIEGTYKKTPTKITNDTLNSYVLPWDDLYFEVFKQGLKWKIAGDILGDPRAVQELAIFDRWIDQMAAAEDLHSGVVVNAPAEPLALGG